MDPAGKLEPKESKKRAKEMFVRITPATRARKYKNLWLKLEADVERYWVGPSHATRGLRPMGWGRSPGIPFIFSPKRPRLDFHQNESHGSGDYTFVVQFFLCFVARQ